jgi:hypothetical protein
MAGECTRAALCHLFMSRWFRVRFERRLAAASGLTLTEVGSNADGQVPVESCRLRSAPSLGVPRVSGVAAEVALFGRERAPPEGGGVRHSGVGNARVVSAVRPVRPVGDGEQQPAHAVVVLARRRRRLSTLSVRVMRGRYATSWRRPQDRKLSRASGRGGRRHQVADPQKRESRQHIGRRRSLLSCSGCCGRSSVSLPLRALPA